MTGQSVLRDVFESRIVSWLQCYLATDDTGLGNLFANERIHELKVADLNDLFGAIVTDEDERKLNFYSLQPSSDEPRIYYVELLTKDDVMERRLAVPIVGRRSFEETSRIVIQQFFESLVAALVATQSDEQASEAAHTKQEGELENMERSNDLVFKDLFGEEKAVEENSTAIEIPEEWDSESMEPSVATYSISLDILDDEEMFEDYEYSEDTVELELDEVALIDFTALNDEIVNLYRAANVEARQALKQVKADLWELELKQEDDEITTEDIRALVTAILAIDVEEQKVLKWQVATARNLL